MSLYVKTKLNDQIEIKVDLYEAEIFSLCPLCGEEHEVGEEVLSIILNSDSDFSHSQPFCPECGLEISNE